MACSGKAREGSGETTLASTSDPTQPQQEVLQAAVAEVPASSSSVLAVTAEKMAPQTPSETLQQRVESAGAVLATSTSAVADKTATAAPGAAAEGTDTQLKALPVLEAKAVEVAASSGCHSFHHVQLLPVCRLPAQELDDRVHFLKLSAACMCIHPQGTHVVKADTYDA